MHKSSRIAALIRQFSSTVLVCFISLGLLACQGTTRDVQQALFAADVSYGSAQRSPTGLPVTAVSFNIRNGSMDDGLDSWPLRRHRVIETIQDHDADFIGLQEAVNAQVIDLLRAFPRYAAAGVHRLDARADGEGLITLYDRERFLLVESGSFFLSETPEVPGSKSWDSAWPRVCTWARFIENGTGHGIYVYNAHLDNKGENARVIGAQMIRNDLDARTTRAFFTDPFILMGDLNATPDSEPLMELLLTEKGPALRDSLEGVAEAAGVGTYTAFKPESDGGPRRIDYVLLSSDLELIGSSIDTRKIDGRYPSDHFPIVSTFLLGK